jgi:hypothetical protein
MNIKLTEFSMRHFILNSHGTKITNVTPEQFEIEVNNQVCFIEPNYKSVEIKDISESDAYIIDGYAPFCKLVAIKNFTNANAGTVPITESNYQYIRSGYSKRNPSELSVLSRWLELPLGKPKAKWLLIVLYNKEQIDKESILDYNKLFSEWESNSNSELAPIRPVPFDADWGIVSILGQLNKDEEPMSPITIIRNAYMHGGSGQPIDEKYYKSAVKFWNENCIVR